MIAFVRRLALSTSCLVLGYSTLASITLADPPDTDGDGVIDSSDNCSSKVNVSQTDSDIDGFGNACDADYDNNGTMGISDYGTFLGSFGLTTASPNWCTNVHPNLDFDANGGIGISDYGFMLNS